MAALAVSGLVGLNMSEQPKRENREVAISSPYCSDPDCLYCKELRGNARGDRKEEREARRCCTDSRAANQRSRPVTEPLFSSPQLRFNSASWTPALGMRCNRIHSTRVRRPIW